jgi:tetratricopeptide (TPR) repeat protein
MQSVRELRVALEDTATVPQFIETMHGHGYRWVGPALSAPEGRAGNRIVAAILHGRLRSRWALAVVGGVVALVLSLVLWSSLPALPGSSIEQDIQRGQIARAQGSSELARRYYEAALIRDSDNIDARVGLATMLYETGDWARAWMLATEVPAPTDPRTNARGRAELDLIAGKIAFGRGHLDLAEAHFLAVRDRFGQSLSPAIHAAALNGLAHVYADQGRIIEYLAIRAEVVDPLLVSAQIEAFAEGLLSAGTMVHPSFDQSWSLPRLQRALTVFEEIGDNGGIARAHTALGSNLMLDDATRERHLQAATILYRSSGHLPGELNVLVHHASFEVERFNDDAAEEYVARGLELSSALDAPRLHADFVFRRGLALMASAEHMRPDERAERIEAAKTAFEMARMEYSDLGVVLDGLAPQFHAAIARLDSGDAIGALADFEGLIRAYQDLPFPPGELGASLGRAASLAKLARHEDAEQMLAEIEQAFPRATPVSAAIRSNFLDVPPGAPTSSLFAIIIGAERQLMTTDRPSD